MSVTINVNNLSLVHKGSNGVSAATLPDVCKTPPIPVPVPYPNISVSSDLAKGTKTITADGGNMAANKGSEFFKSTGDEPGVAGGVVSGVNMKESTWITFSFDVKLEGKNACRLTDKKFHNHGNTVNMGGEVQKPLQTKPWDLDCLLKILCKDAEGRKTVEQISKYDKVTVADEITWDDHEWDGKKWNKVNPVGLGGADKSSNSIQVLSGMSCEGAADTFFHENIHMQQPDGMKWADKELEAYTKTEEWLIKNNLPGKFRKQSGGKTVVDHQKIRDHVIPKPGSGGGYPIVPDGVIVDHFPDGTVTVQDDAGKEITRKAKVGETAPGPQRLKNARDLDPKKFKCPAAKSSRTKLEAMDAS